MALRLHPVVNNLRRAPGFTALVVLTLALGIGATTAMFSVVDAVLIRPLPFPHADRINEIWTRQPTGSNSPGVVHSGVHYLREHLAGVADVEGYQMRGGTITGGSEPDVVGAPLISPRLLALVGAVPHLGRLFTNDDLTSGTRVAIISHRYWVTQFGSDPGIVGRRIEIDDQAHTIVGVMSPRVRYPEANAAVWRPLDLMTPTTNRGARVMIVTVRHPGVAADQLDARLAVAADALMDIKMLPQGARLEAGELLQARFGRSDAKGFWLMFGAVNLVLLVACVNVSNLVLARARSRQSEFAVRCALGAGQGRLVRIALGECLVLAAASGVLGIAAAQMLLTLLLEILPPPLTYLAANTSELNGRVLAYVAAVSFASCVLSGLLPAIHAARVDPAVALRRDAPHVPGHDDLWHGCLIVTQLALVLVLLAGAGVLTRSFIKLISVDPGFNPDGLLVLDLGLPISRYPTPDATQHLLAEVEQRLENMDGAHVSWADGAPLTSPSISFNVTPEAEGAAPPDFMGMVLPFVEVAPDYFATLGIPILAGRTFAKDDPYDVAVVNDRLAARYWGSASPLGKRFRKDDSEPWKTVVGVVGDTRQMGLHDPTGHGMELYFPQHSKRVAGQYSLIIRTSGDARIAAAAAKQVVWSIDPRIPIDGGAMNDRIGESLYRQRFYLRLSATFAIIAVLLAMVGVYAAFAYWVAQRRRELAIRMAVGASARDVVVSVVARTVRLAAAGAVAGLVIAIAGGNAIRSILFATDARDPMTLSLATALLVAAALAASLGPAVRAGRVDPMSTLRAE